MMKKTRALLLLSALFLPGLSAAPALAADALDTSTDTVSSDDLDVTVTGEAKDDVAIAKAPPALGIPFQALVTLPRENQTENVLAQPVEHMPFIQEVLLLEVKSQQTISPIPVQISTPPFFQTEAPTNLKAVRWEFQVVDQENKTVHMSQGEGQPDPLLHWDGFTDGYFRLLVGPAYTPILTVTDEKGLQQRYFGDPLQLEVVKYDQDGLLHIEMDNNRLYERGGADFVPEMSSLLEAALNSMRRRVGAPFRLTIHEDPKNHALAKKRLEKWKSFLNKQLMLEEGEINAEVARPSDRGKVTDIMMLANP